jgi:hypothetical protein
VCSVRLLLALGRDLRSSLGERIGGEAARPLDYFLHRADGCCVIVGFSASAFIRASARQGLELVCVGARYDTALKLRGKDVVVVVEGRCVPHGFVTGGVLLVWGWVSGVVVAA